MATTKNRYRAGRNTDAAQENIEILTGQRGNGLDRALTLRDLASTSLVNVSKTRSGTYVISSTLGSDSANIAIPTTPTGFVVSGAFSSIALRWDAPKYYGHAYTEIWRGTVESFTDAALIATTPATVFGDMVSTGSSYYYWIRHVNTKNRAGAYNATLGTLGETSRDVSDITDDIGEQMRSSALVQELLSQDELLESTISQLNQTTVDDSKIITKTISQVNAAAKAVTDAQTAIENAKVTEVKEAIATIDENGTVAYRAMWAIKASAGDITTGIGILADSEGTSQVAISASQFFVFDPNTEDSITPLFAISDGAVTIPQAFIESATIQILQAQEITADYVNAGISIETPTITSAVINGAELNIGAGGPYGGYHTKITAEGVIYTDYLVASGGTLDNLTINETCDVKGTVYAKNIVGDVVDASIISTNKSTHSPAQSSWITVGTKSYTNTVGRQACLLVNMWTVAGSISSRAQYTYYYLLARVLVDGVVVLSATGDQVYFGNTADVTTRVMRIPNLTVPSVSKTVNSNASGTITLQIAVQGTTNYRDSKEVFSINCTADCLVIMAPIGDTFS